MGFHVANPERLRAKAVALAFRPPAPVDLLNFAETEVVFSERESRFPGPYNRSRFPYFDEILNACGSEDPCRIVTVQGSAQLGKTVCANIFTLGSLHLDPGDFLYTHPTEANARKWSRTKLAPMLKNTTCLAPAFPQKSRDGADSILYKERADGRGSIIVGGANSEASLSLITVKRQVQDDLAKWETNDAGDPEAQADSRSQAHEFAKIFKISTPMILPGCKISRSFKSGSQEVPEVPCPHCEHFQVLEWGNMLANLDEEHPEMAAFSCVECGGVIEEKHRRGMVARLRWTARNPKAKRYHRSFYIWSAYSVLMSWEAIARRWLQVRGNPSGEQEFLNNVVGQPWETAGEAPPWEQLRDRAAKSDYELARIPPGALILTIGVDCQKDFVAWQLVGWGRDFRRFVIDYGTFDGHISEKGCQEKLNGLLAQSWPNAWGRKIRADLLGIDGNAWTEEVWSWVKGRPVSQVIMVRGANSELAPKLARVKKERNDKTGKPLRYSRRFYNFGSSVLKHRLYRNLAKTDPLERGFVGLPKGVTDQFLQELTAERRQEVARKKDGSKEWRWILPPNTRNEFLDNHLQAEAAAIKFGVDGMPDQVWDRFERERESAPEAQQGDLEDLIGRPAAAAARPSAPPSPPSPPKAAEPAGPTVVVTAAGAPPDGDKPAPSSPGGRMSRRLA